MGGEQRVGGGQVVGAGDVDGTMKAFGEAGESCVQQVVAGGGAVLDQDQAAGVQGAGEPCGETVGRDVPGTRDVGMGSQSGPGRPDGDFSG